MPELRYALLLSKSKVRGWNGDMREFNGFVICNLPPIDVLNMEEIDKIVEHTHNTWQKNRSIDELRKNTIQGKRAEYVVENLLHNKSQYRYKSYDSIREDKYEKHAPFDGIIYAKSLDDGVLFQAIDTINNDVKKCSGDFGLIEKNTRMSLDDIGIYTVEIKSSLLQDPRDYRTMVHRDKNSRTEEDYSRLCEYIRGFYDYFVYPHYCRDSKIVESFYDYTVYYRQNYEKNEGGFDRLFIKSYGG